MAIRASLKLLAVELVLLMQFGQSSQAQQSEPSLIKLEAGTEYELSNVQAESTIRVPVTIQEGVATIAVSLVDVAIGTRHDQTLFQSFCVRMEAVPGANTVPAMLVTVKAAGLEQGKYELLVRAQSAKKAPSGDCTLPLSAKPQPAPPSEKPMKARFIKLYVILPAARLQSLSPLTVEQVVPFFGEPQTLGGPSLLLWETSGHKTRLIGINAEQVDIPSGVNQPTHAKINFDPPAEVAPGAVAHAPIKLSGSFPLGSTKGAARVVSPQLSEPLSISFEIKARRSKCAIVIVMVLGLMAGFFLRTWSTRRVELDEARQKALDFADTLEQQLQQRPDVTFQKPVRTALDALRASVANAKAEELAAAVTAAHTALANAMTDLDNRRALAQDQLAAFSRLTHTDWLLPTEVGNAFKVDEQELAQAGLEIDHQDIARQTGRQTGCRSGSCCFALAERDEILSRRVEQYCRTHLIKRIGPPHARDNGN